MAEASAPPSAAEEAKQSGTAAFKAGRFDDAVAHFTTAIEADPQSHVLFSNRSAAYAKLEQYKASGPHRRRTHAPLSCLATHDCLAPLVSPPPLLSHRRSLTAAPSPPLSSRSRRRSWTRTSASSSLPPGPRATRAAARPTSASATGARRPPTTHHHPHPPSPTISYHLLPPPPPTTTSTHQPLRHWARSVALLPTHHPPPPPPTTNHFANAVGGPAGRLYSKRTRGHRTRHRRGTRARLQPRGGT